jgi:ribosomal protein L37E
MDIYSDNPPRNNPKKHVRCKTCDQPSFGYYYCRDCRRDHAERMRQYMAKRRQDINFAAAERVATKLRMRRLLARRRREVGAPS